MSTTRETVLAALLARLQSLASLVQRDEVLPERIPTSGLIILRDGQPGEPEVTLSPLRYHYQHRAELEVVVQAPNGRATAFDTLNAAALVWSNAPVIIGAHDTGPLIRSKDGFWLAIPTPAAGKSTKGGRITPGEWERRTGLRLRFIYRRRGPSLLVAEGRLNSKGRAVASRSKTRRGVATVPIFLLVPQVKLRKRLDLARDAERAVDSVPGRIVAGWVSKQDSAI
jgi:hypothetical protein